MATCPKCGQALPRTLLFKLFWGGFRRCLHCSTPIRIAGDREMPAWRFLTSILPSTIFAYLIVAPLDIPWSWRTPIGLGIIGLLMAGTALLTAPLWRLTAKAEHLPRQYDPDVPEEPVVPGQLQL